MERLFFTQFNYFLHDLIIFKNNKYFFLFVKLKANKKSIYTLKEILVSQK